LVSVVKIPLTLLFNLSLTTGIFPAVCGGKRDISCYRGISILSVITKLFEEMIFDEITPIIRPQIAVMQHGFIKGRFTVTNLVYFSNFVIDQIEKDIRLMECIRNFEGLRPSEPWLVVFGLDEKFLGDDDRTERVRLDDFLSDMIYCHPGVLQGSHLECFSMFPPWHMPMISNFL
jgi:hypothetical protein